MKKLGFLFFLFLFSIAGVFGQSLNAVTFSLSGEGQFILNNKEDAWGLTTSVGISVNYTKIFDSGFTLMADMNWGLPVYSISGDDEGNIEEFTLDDYELAYVDNLYLGFGYAPVNRRGNYMTLTAGPNVDLTTQSYLLGAYKIEVFTLGLGLNWGLGFFINRNAVFSINLKAGYNFIGNVTYSFGEETSETEMLEDYHVLFFVPSVGFGFTF